jgi:preprotein translocase subunit Sec61beta
MKKLQGVTRENHYPNGALKDVTLSEENCLNTKYGTLIPRYQIETGREKQTVPVSFYESGAIKKIALQNQTPISTSIGTFPAELVTFYESGNLKRLFPLNGQISGFWTEENEADLAEPFSFSFPFATFRAKIVGLSFYETGAVKSLTLWPNETVEVTTPIGLIVTKNGFSLHPNGALASVEPTEPYKLSTPVGVLRAFDKESLGITADQNSLQFSESGEIVGVSISDQMLFYREGENADWIQITPVKKMHPLWDDVWVDSPIHLEFYEKQCAHHCGEHLHIPVERNRFSH